MTLDEIEKLARDYAASCEDTGNAGCIGHDLASALLLVMPVATAAVAWRAIRSGQHTNGPQHMLAMRDTDRALAAAIDTMRAALAKDPA